MKKLFTSLIALMSFVSMTQTGLAAESLVTPWDTLKVGDHVKGMRVSYITVGSYPSNIALDGKKLVSGTVSCNDGDYGYMCTIKLAKASQGRFPWPVTSATLECLKAGQDACDSSFAEKKNYRVTMTISQLRDSRCTECDFLGPVLRMEKLTMKREIK